MADDDGNGTKELDDRYILVVEGPNASDSELVQAGHVELTDQIFLGVDLRDSSNTPTRQLYVQ